MTKADQLKAESNEQLRNVVHMTRRDENIAKELVGLISSWEVRARGHREAQEANAVAEKAQEAVERAKERRNEAIRTHGEFYRGNHGWRMYLDQEVKQAEEWCERATAARDDYVPRAEAIEVLCTVAMKAVQEEQLERSKEALWEIRDHTVAWY